jgi:hypothetical protein
MFESQPALDRRPHVLDEDICGVDQPEQHLVCFGNLQVEAKRSLVAVKVLEVGAVPVFPGHSRHVRVGRRLYPDHVGTPVGQLAHAGGSGAGDGEIDHAHVVERKAHRLP